MLVLLNNKKIREISVNSNPCNGRIVTWHFPIELFVCLYNPFNPRPFVKPFFSIIRSGGFHFMGIRVSWSQGAEIRNKRTVTYI